MHRAVRSLIIIGAGGHGKVVADTAIHTGKYDQIAFLDDADIACSGGIKVIGRVNNAKEYASFADFVIAVGQSSRREAIQEKLTAMNVRFASLVHPSAVIANGVEIGDGAVVMANVVVNTGTTIGKYSIVNTGATVDHDCRIGDFVHISPGAHVSGTVEIGKGTWVSVGACVVNNVSVCPGCVIGAGAVVLKSIDVVGTYVGIPTRKI